MSVGKIKPAENAIVLTKSDTVNIASPSGQAVTTRALYIGGAGDISVEMAGDQMADQTVLFSALPAGTVLPISITRLNSTSTDATLVVAVW